jgi:hypothetical protein
VCFVSILQQALIGSMRAREKMAKALVLTPKLEVVQRFSEQYLMLKELYTERQAALDPGAAEIKPASLLAGSTAEQPQQQHQQSAAAQPPEHLAAPQQSQAQSTEPQVSSDKQPSQQLSQQQQQQAQEDSDEDVVIMTPQ